MRNAAAAALSLHLSLLLCVSEGVKDISHLTKVNPPGGIQGTVLNRRTNPRPESLPPDPDAFFVDMLVEGTKEGRAKQALGSVTLKVSPSWAPKAAARFKELLDERFYDGTKFHEVIDGTNTRGMKVVQGGIGANPQTNEKWAENFIEDDERAVTNRKGTVCFAQLGPGQRATQILVHLADNSRMFDRKGDLALTPFAEVVDGLEVLESLEGTEPLGERDDDAIQKAIKHGNVYLDDNFPDLPYIKTARVRTSTPGGLKDKADRFAKVKKGLKVQEEKRNAAQAEQLASLQTMAKQATDEGKFDAAIALLEQAQKLKAEL